MALVNVDGRMDVENTMGQLDRLKYFESPDVATLRSIFLVPESVSTTCALAAVAEIVMYFTRKFLPVAESSSDAPEY